MIKGEREVPKRRAEVFFRLKQGEFIVFADGIDRKVQFKRPQIKKDLPTLIAISSQELEKSFLKIHGEVKSMFK